MTRFLRVYVDLDELRLEFHIQPTSFLQQCVTFSKQPEIERHIKIENDKQDKVDLLGEHLHFMYVFITIVDIFTFI